jgi:lipid II isoglutaminyl synthase (glutamine-hydrolysing)
MLRLVICQLYPDLMSIYGDRGNVTALVQRARWRGIDATVTAHSIGSEGTLDDADLFFFGGGQDRQQVAVSQHLQGDTGRRLADAHAHGAAFLAICGGYQLLGHYFRTGTGEEVPGTGLLDVSTVAGDRRFIGDVIAECDEAALRRAAGLPVRTAVVTTRTLVGFENHSGLTSLGQAASPLATTRVGCGNNGRDRTEGAVAKACIGSYLHGSLLPKNPWLTDFLLEAALKHRVGHDVELEPLDDSAEDRAHQAAADRIARRGRVASAIKH